MNVSLHRLENRARPRPPSVPGLVASLKGVAYDAVVGGGTVLTMANAEKRALPPAASWWRHVGGTLLVGATSLVGIASD